MVLLANVISTSGVFFGLKILASLLLASVAARFFWCCTRLRGIPGPFLASFTELWRVHAQTKKNSGLVLEALHKKYGLVVRVGPNTVSIADPAAVPKIYGTKTVYKKAPSYYTLDALTKTGERASTLASTRDENFHSSMKKPIVSAFTVNALLDYEAEVDGTIDDFVRGVATAPGPIRFNEWTQCALKRQSPSPASILAQQRLASRTSADVNVKKDLLQKYLDARTEHKTLTDPMVLGLTVSTIAAGADTARIGIMAILYHVYRNPEVLRKLRQEITDYKMKGFLSEDYKFSETQKMPYLEIVVRESLRVHTVAGLMLERIVPAGGLEVAGNVIPEGTVVGCSPWVLHQQESVYGPDTDKFKPERWLVDEEKKRMMDRSSLEFGGGKRVCIGKNIAKLNIYKLVPRVINDLDIEFLNDIELIPNSLSYVAPLFAKIRPRS